MSDVPKGDRGRGEGEGKDKISKKIYQNRFFLFRGH